MKYMYALLFVLAGSPALASVYATEERAREGLKLGDKTLSRGVFFLQSTRDDDSMAIQGNGTLIAPNKILTCKTLLQRQGFHSAMLFSLERDEEVWMPIKSFEPHPTMNLAIATLRYPLPFDKMKPLDILPILWEEAIPSNGYVISVGDVHALPVQASLKKRMRHLSVLSVETLDIPLMPDSLATTLVWATRWTMPLGENPMTGFLGKVFEPKAEDHRLTAYPQPGDVCSPFVVKHEGKHKLGGIYIGNTVINFGGGPEVLSCVLPLYKAADWIRANM